MSLACLSSYSLDIRRTGLDKAASLRFIKHAIAQSKLSGPPSENAAAGSSQDANNIPVPVKVTSKMAERVAYEKQLKELGSEEEDDLEVFGNGEDANVEIIEELAAAEGKRKPDIMQESQLGTKRRRPIMDPFAGSPFELLLYFVPHSMKFRIWRRC